MKRDLWKSEDSIMITQHDYRIYVGDNPGPMLRLLIETGKVIVQFVADLAKKMREHPRKQPPEEGRVRVVRLYGESIGRVYDAFRFAGLKPNSATVYSRYVGRLFKWMAEMGITQLTPQVVDDFLDFIVSSREVRTDEKGSYVRHVGYYALRKFMLLSCYDDLVALLLPPPPPEPKPPTSVVSLHSLFDHATSICDLLLLIVTNVLHISTGAAVTLTWDNFAPDFEYVTIGEGENAIQQEIPLPYRGILAKLKSRSRSHYLLAGSGMALEEPEPVTWRSAEYRYRRIADRSGIPERTTMTSSRRAEAVPPDLLERILQKALT